MREICDKHGALLILDEIRHCLGRAGKMFTCEHYDVVPGLLVIGKGLGGGILPMAALIARENLDIASDRALGRYTHEKNPVACAAVLAAIETIEKGGLSLNAERVGDHALEVMRGMMEKHRLIGDVRGLLMGIELVHDRASASGPRTRRNKSCTVP